MPLTDAQLEELLRRSADGEGILAMLKEFGCDDAETMDWLRDNHHDKLKAAKREFGEKAKRAPV